ncbi:hypothetical protein A4X06_0g3180 [Tilletia controversa]|uniref:Hexosyltransferase n=2 Tax=Tilletia TaxID=13289 RepID=A0A8X7SY76_9BASI|nr:hypothetical protein CF328_g5074 [Tilletia controversa]KAE8201417.1 hypothetical protein CF336_g212 [Tilletia laevis]KAE8207916.1 hypothetical protein CF335_g796 [Tilletia laevis]KAE8249549.1 hypothetical protein A4X06_0g3180 [Tilletia controversa]KAE8262486.1 hypothetical protein A4X03_0g2416 [Tilletia caries]
MDNLRLRLPLLFLLPLLFVILLVNSAPLPRQAYTSCPAPPRPSPLEVRSGPPVRADEDLLENLLMTHHDNWQRLKTEARRLRLQHFENMTPSVERRIQRLLAASRGAREGARQVMAEIDELEEAGIRI